MKSARGSAETLVVGRAGADVVEVAVAVAVAAVAVSAAVDCIGITFWLDALAD